ncbi:MAG: hypothetical protein KF763_15595 [Cyclobacteriaceae bacterium]|nr:hypothetical protein [Cyclobacteriaceae bacterium]
MAKGTRSLKYFLYSIAITFSSSSAFAQIESGAVVLGVKIEVTSHKYLSYELSQGGFQGFPMKVSEFDFYAMPSVSFVASRNFELGIQVGYARVHRNVTDKHINLSPTYVLYQGESTSSGFVYGGFVKYKMFLSTRLAIPITATLNRVSTKGSGIFLTGSSPLGQTISVERSQRFIRPELFYKFSDRLNASISFVSYYFMESDYTEKYDKTFAVGSNYTIKENGFNFNLGVSVNFVIP